MKKPDNDADGKPELSAKPDSKLEKRSDKDNFNLVERGDEDDLELVERGEEDDLGLVRRKGGRFRGMFRGPRKQEAPSAPSAPSAPPAGGDQGSE